MLPIILILLAVSVYDVIRRPTIRRLALRNLTRRRSEATLVILGSLLGTAIITAALIVGDTLGASVRDHARTNYGPVDEVVRTIGADKAEQIAGALKQTPLARTDGLLKMVATGGSVATRGSDPRAAPYVQLLEVNFDEARAFGAQEAITGMGKAGPTPAGTEVVIDRQLADKVGVAEGDTITVFAYGQSKDVRVRQVLPTLGIAGFGSPNLFLPPGTIASFVGSAGAGTAASSGGNRPNSMVLVSNTGGVFDGAKLSDPVGRELTRRVASLPGVEVSNAKQELLTAADDNAAQFKQIFGGIGAFSVIAGVLLLVNIFVMLADERKSELGMLRAIGLKRNQLVRVFGLEGAIYALVSSVFGVIVGIGVGRVVVVFAASIFKRGGGFGDRHLDLIFAVKSGSLSKGFMLGAAISLITVWVTSIRLGRLNVIRAIRDIAEAPVTGGRRVRSMVFAALGVLVGLLLLLRGVNQQDWFGALAGVPIAAFSSITLLRPLVGRRLSVLVGAGVALVWGIAVFTVLPAALEKTEFNAFVVQGVILVGAAVAIVATNDDLAIRVVNSLGVSKRTLATRLGFAYPLARVFRTSMLLGMYSIVVFTLTFLSVFSNLFGAQAPRFARETAAGYDVLVDSNYANPVPPSVIARADPSVIADTVLFEAYPKWTTQDQPKKTSWQISGFDESLLARGTPALHKIDPKYPDAHAAWEAVLHDPTLVILPDFFLQGGGPPSTTIHPGDSIRVYDNLSGKQADLKVAAKIESDFVFNGPMVSQSFLRHFTADATPSRHYVALKPGTDAKLVAARLEGKLVSYGVDANTFEGKIGKALSQQEGFLGLMRGYLALGLVIGIAGLGVVMVRAVRERRRQIGMLRAMGFASRIVRQAFLIEAAFIAVQGIILGTVLALVTSYNLLTHSSTFGGQSIKFEIPWLPIFVVLGVALVASLIASAVPAGQASRIKPAVALRIAD